MTMRTGTSKSGKVHSYYSCSTHGRQGKTGCQGRAIPMSKLDTLVTDHLVSELLQPDRLRSTLSALWASRAEKAAEVDGRVGALQAEITTAEDKLKRLYAMVEDGMTDLDDILKERLAALKLDRDRAKAALDRIRINERPEASIAPDLVERFGRLMRENVTAGEIPFRKAWIQSIVDRVEVDDHVIRIIGDKSNLEHAIMGGFSAATTDARGFVRKWRAHGESNPGLIRERDLS